VNAGEQFYKYAKFHSLISKTLSAVEEKSNNIPSVNNDANAKFVYFRSELIEENLWTREIEYAQDTAILFLNKFREKLGIPSVSMTEDFGYYVKWSKFSKHVIGVIYHNYISVAYLDKDSNPIVDEVSGDRIEKIRFLNDFLEKLSNDARS